MTTRKTRLNTESPTPNSGSDSAPSTPSTTRKRLVRKINETGKLDDKDDTSKTNSPNRSSRPRLNRNSLLNSTKSPVAVKVRRKVQSTGGSNTPDIDINLPTKRVRRRNSTGKIEVERKQSERLIKKLRSGKSHKSLMSSPNPDKIKVVRKRLRLKDKTEANAKLKKITKPRKVDKIETASDSELLLPVRRRSDSVSKCSDITDTSSYMDVPLVMLKDTDDTFSNSGGGGINSTIAPLDTQQEDTSNTSNDIPLREMIKKELLLNESIKEEEEGAAVSVAATEISNTNDIKIEPQPIEIDVKKIKVEITTNDDSAMVKDKSCLNSVTIGPSSVNANSLDKKSLDIKEHSLLVDTPILNDSGIGGDADITPQQKPLTEIPISVVVSSPEIPTTVVVDENKTTTTTTTNSTDDKSNETADDEIVKRKRVKKIPIDLEKPTVKPKTIRKPNTAVAVTKAKEKVRANAKLKTNIKQRQSLIQTTAATISIPLRIQPVPTVPPPSSKIPTTTQPSTGAAVAATIPIVAKKENISESSTAQVKNKSPSPVLMSVGVSEISVKQFYGQPDFLENNLGIEKDPKLGEIVQEKNKLISTDVLPSPNLKVPSPISITTSTTTCTTETAAVSECTSTANSTPRKINSPETDHDSSQEILPEDRLRIEDSDTAGNSSEGIPTPKKERLSVATTTVETIQTHDRTIIEITTSNGIQHHSRMLGGMASVTSSQPISVGDSIKCVTVTEQRQHDRPRSSATALANLNGTLDKPLSMEVELIPILPTTAIKPAQNVNSISVEPIESAAPAPPATIVPITAAVLTSSISQDPHIMTEPDNKENIILNKVKESMMIEENKIVVTPIPPIPVVMPTNEIKVDLPDVKTDSISIIKKVPSEPNASKVINETPELIKQKESLLLTLGLLSHQAAGAAKMQHKHKREEAQKSRKISSEYTGSLKTIIKLPRPTVNSSGTGVAATAGNAVTTATAIGINNQSMSLAQSSSHQVGGSDKKKPVRESLKMTLHKARGKSTTDREQTTNSDGTDTYYTIQNETTNSSGFIGTEIATTITLTDGANGGQSRKTHYRSHNTSDSALHSTNDSSESTAIGAIKEKDDEIVIPEKASSFRIHPGKLCQDQCFYCGGKFGLFDTPCHVAQIKSMDRQKKILDNEDKLTVDNCLCDACFRHVDRRANCPSYKKRLSAPSTLTSNQYNMNDGQSDTENGTTSIVPKSACQVVECLDGATHSVRRKWFMKMRKSIAKLLNLSPEVTAHGNVSMLWVCDKHYDVISHLMVCALCKRKLLRNHIYYITQDTVKLQQLLTAQGVPVTIGTSLVVCKLCRYYSNILLKPPEPKSPKIVFAKNYRRRLLQFHNIEIVFDSDTDSQPSESPRKSRPTKRSRKSSPDSQKSNDSDGGAHKKSMITSGGGQMLLDNDVLVGYDPPPLLIDQTSNDSSQPLLAKILPPYPAAVTSILSTKPLMTTAAQAKKSQQLPHHLIGPPQPQPQKDLQTQSKEDISLLRANPNISMRELFPGEEEMGLLVNIPFGSAGLTRTPEGWTKVNTSIQYDEPTRHLWEELQKPYGNQSSFLRHLILLEKYFRQGDLILSENASGNASVYSTSVQHRLQSFDNRGAAAMANFLKSTRSSDNTAVNLSTSSSSMEHSNPPMVTIPGQLPRPQKSRQPPTATITAIQQQQPQQQLTSNTETATSLLKSNYDSRGRPLRYAPGTKDHHRSVSTVSRKDSKQETVKCTKTAKIPVGLPPELICINTSIANQQSLLSQQQQLQQQSSSASSASTSSSSSVSQVTAMIQQQQQQQQQQQHIAQTLSMPHQPQTIKMSTGLDSKKSKHNPSGISVSLSGSNTNLSGHSAANLAQTISGHPNSSNAPAGRNIPSGTPEVIRLPEVLSISERNESRNWRPTLMPVTAGPPALNGQLYQTADGRKLPNLVQVQSGGKPYLISIHDYNRMCIVRRERLLRDQILRQQQSMQAMSTPSVQLTNSIAEAIQRTSNQHLQAMAQSVLQNLPLSSTSTTPTAMTSRHSLLPPLPPPPYTTTSGQHKIVPNIIDITSKTPAAPLIPPSPILPFPSTSTSSSGKIQIPNKILEQNSVIPLTTQSSTLSSAAGASSTFSKSSTLDSLLKVRKPNNNINSSTSSLLKPNINNQQQQQSKSYGSSGGGGGAPTTIPAVVCVSSQSLPPFDPNVISITSTPSISAILGMSPMSDTSLPSTSATTLREPQSALDILLKSGNILTNQSSSPSANSSSSTPTTTMPTSSMWLWAESLSNNNSNGSSSTSVGSITVTTTASPASAGTTTTPLSGIDTAAANLLSKIPKSLTVIPQQKSRTSTSVSKLTNDDVTTII